jgi:hypothetical protein
VTAPGAAANAVVDAVLADLGKGSHRGVVVDSPPGAGKSTLVVKAAQVLAAAGEQLIVIAQTNEQVDDLIDRLAVAAPDLPIGRLSAGDYRASERVLQHRSVTVGAKIGDVAQGSVIIATAAKWATVAEGSWAWAIVDEAYQMRSDALLRVASRFSRALFVGDPGQLDPFSTVESARWTGLTWDPMLSAVNVLLRHNPDLPVHRLPVSWRLPPSAAEVVAPAFYPFTGFRAGTSPGDRSLVLDTGLAVAGASGSPGGAGALGAAANGGLVMPDPDAVDAAVAQAAATGWALYELPARHTIRTDGEAAAACAALALRVLEAGAVAVSERSRDGAPVDAGRIAIGTAHRDQAAVIRNLLRGTPGETVTVDTANRLQGREYDVTIVLHPLSGRRDATAFHLESGRLCVLTSRHRHACIVVARAGIPDLLDAHPSTDPVHLNVPVTFPDGWEANHSILAHLTTHRVIAPR